MKTHIIFSPAITHLLRLGGRISGAVGPCVPGPAKAWPSLSLTTLEQSFTLLLWCNCCLKAELQMHRWMEATKVGRTSD